MPRLARALTAAAVLAFAAACTNAGSVDPAGVEFDAATFDPIPEIEELDWSAVDPAADWDYWEVRMGMGGGGAHDVLGSGGALTRDQLDADTRAALDATSPSSGFSEGCPPAYCYRYVVAVDDGALTTFVTRDGLGDFLGTVDSREEAVLLVASRSHTWWDAGESTGTRPANAGWDVVVLELVAHCAPVQTDRVRFHVDTDGRIAQRGREVWEHNERMCI